MLGIGMQEMLLIGLAALLLFGPGKLPEVMGQAGKWYKQFRDVTSELSGEFNKTVAEAKGELEGVVGDLGPMQKQVNSISKSVQKDLGGSAKGKTGTAGKKTTSTRSTTSSSAKKTGTSTAGKSSASKSTTASKSASKTTSARTNTSTSGAKSPASKPNMTSGKPVVVASKEDPIASVSLFEQAERKPTRRARSATPSMFTDLTPRDSGEQSASEAAPDPVKSGNAAPVFDPEDPIARARQRRMRAGYAQASA